MMTNAQLVTKLKAIVEVVEEIGGSIGSGKMLIEDELNAYPKEIGVNTSSAKAAHTTKAQMRSQEIYLDGILLSAADCNRDVGCLLQELNSYALRGHYTFPATLSEALDMLNGY